MHFWMEMVVFVEVEGRGVGIAILVKRLSLTSYGIGIDSLYQSEVNANYCMVFSLLLL